MTPLGELTIPAARLRAGDRLLAHQSATVARPPVISPDGAMVTALLDFSEPHVSAILRVLRVPVEQTVTVIRTPAESGRTMVRKTKVARSSGAQILVLDLVQPDAEFAGPDGQPYATLCTVHHTIRFHSSVSTAEAISSHPEEWCPECANLTRQRAQVRVAPPTSARRLA